MILVKTVETSNSPSKCGECPMLRVTKYKLLGMFILYKKVEEVKDGGKIKK
jgi:hypothetical protein